MTTPAEELTNRRRRVTILYGTETGTAKEFAARISALVADTLGPPFGVSVGYAALDDVAVNAWPTLGGPVIFVCSTTGQGDTPSTMLNSWAHLRRVDAPRLDGLDYAVFGLGDSTYAKFNYPAKMLHNRLKQLGADPLVHRGLGDEQDANGHDDEFSPWIMELWPALVDCLLLPPSAADASPSSSSLDPSALFPIFKAEQAPPEAARPNTWRVVSPLLVEVLHDDHHVSDHPGGGGKASASSSAVVAAPSPPATVPIDDHVPNSGAAGALLQAAIAPATSTAPDQSLFDLTVTAVTRLTAADHFQNVTEIRFARPAGFNFKPTDSLGFVPTNDFEEARWLAARYGNPVIRVRPNSERYVLQPVDRIFEAAPAPLEQVLLTYFDLGAAAKRSLFAVLAQATADPEEMEKFTELSLSVSEYDRFCFREKRTTCEVLRDFPAVRVPLDLLLSNLPPMTTRWYSIASAPSDAEVLTCCVALLQFSTPFKRTRYGVCSQQIVRSKPGDIWRNCRLRSGTGVAWPPSVDVATERTTTAVGSASGIDASKPMTPTLILIGPGTGIAPCRSLWREAATRSGGVRTYVFTGNRARGKDDLYADELHQRQDAAAAAAAAAAAESTTRDKERCTAPLLRHFPALSRETPSYPCRYVQHALVREAATVAEALRHPASVVFVSGNSKRMPQDVEDAIVSILANRVCDGESAGDAAAAMLRTMKAEGRYVTDTWS